MKLNTYSQIYYNTEDFARVWCGNVLKGFCCFFSKGRMSFLAKTKAKSTWAGGFRDEFVFSACRPARLFPTLLPVSVQLQCSDRTACCSTPAAQRPLRDLWLSPEHFRSTFHLWFSLSVRVYVCFCKLTLRGSIQTVAKPVPCILLVAVLNCPTASGL